MFQNLIRTNARTVANLFAVCRARHATLVAIQDGAKIKYSHIEFELLLTLFMKNKELVKILKLIVKRNNIASSHLDLTNHFFCNRMRLLWRGDHPVVFNDTFKLVMMDDGLYRY